MSEELVVVVGGNGFIGRRLVERLIESGCRVRVVSRQGLSSVRGVESIAADVSDAAAIERALEGAGCVYSLSTGGGESWAEFERDIIGGARNVAEACLRNGVRRFIYTSSIAALYLGSERSIPDSQPADSQTSKRSYYARAKALAEAELLRQHKEKALPVSIARPGVVMGRGGPVTHSGLGTWTTDVDCIGWGAGEHPLPFVLVDDVADALCAARNAAGLDGLAWNLAGDVEIRAREFVEEYGERSLRRIRFHARPVWQLWLVDVFKWLVKVAARKAENPFPYYRDYASRSLRSRLECGTARQKLGWKPNGNREDFLSETINDNLPGSLRGDLRLTR